MHVSRATVRKNFYHCSQGLATVCTAVQLQGVHPKLGCFWVSPYWSRNDPIYQVIFSTVLVPYKMHAESWELDLNSEFRVLTSWISLTLSSTIQNACNNKNDLKVGIDFQCSMNMVPKCRAQFMHDWIPAVLSARTRDCRRRPDLIARAENHNSTQPGCHVASRTRSTDLQKMTWYFRSFPAWAI